MDFNDTGFGPYAYDLAVTWRSVTDAAARASGRRKDDATAAGDVEAALVAGYESVVALPPGWGSEVKAIALIRLLRWRSTRDPADLPRLLGRLQRLTQ